MEKDWIIEIEVADTKPLSVNEAWQGRRFKTKKYEDYEKELFAVFGKAKKPIEGPVEIEYAFHLVNANRTDLDNLIKPLQDIIVKLGYLKDDRQIMKMTVTKKKHSINCIYFGIKKYGTESN